MLIHETLHGAWTGRSKVIAPADAWPANWVTVAPPTLAEGETAIWSPLGVWVMVTGWSPPTPPAPPVPAKIHKVWATMVLEAWGVIDDVEDALDAAWTAGNKSLKRFWLAAGDIHRADPRLATFATSFGWSAEQLDQIFVQGAAYEAAAGAV